MLKIVNQLRDLDFSQLMDVYAEGNRENGGEFYPHLPPREQVLQAEQDFYSFLRENFFRQTGSFYCVWIEKGQYVSALRLEPYQDGLLLEALETHPDYRCRGYAKQLIAAALETVSDQKVYVHIHKRNAPSIAVHEASGFKKVLDHAVYADGSVLLRSNTYLYEKTTL